MTVVFGVFCLRSQRVTAVQTWLFNGNSQAVYSVARRHCHWLHPGPEIFIWTLSGLRIPPRRCGAAFLLLPLRQLPERYLHRTVRPTSLPVWLFRIFLEASSPIEDERRHRQPQDDRVLPELAILDSS